MGTFKAHPYSFGFSYAGRGDMKGSWVTRAGDALVVLKIPLWQQRMMDLYPSSWALFASEIKFPARVVIHTDGRKKMLNIHDAEQMRLALTLMRDDLILLSDSTALGGQLRRFMYPNQRAPTGGGPA